jgi:ArsR family transcriptional regulator, lead/cadmium/zinc/bismuth-responsive transcriptional repressor
MFLRMTVTAPRRVRRATGRGAAPLDEATAADLAGVFKALADPSRLRLVSALVAGERCVHELTALLGMEQSAVSHQLRTLRHLQLVRRRKDGRHVFYRLDDSHVRRLFEFAVEHVEHTRP